MIPFLPGFDLSNPNSLPLNFFFAFLCSNLGQCVRPDRNLGTQGHFHTGVWGPDGILGRPKIPDFFFRADSKSAIRFLIALSPQIPVATELSNIFGPQLITAPPVAERITTAAGQPSG